MAQPTLAQRYAIEAVAGRGGMGVVYRARDIRTGEPVAIKALKKDAAEHLSRFVREVGMLAAQNHPAIVRYITHGYAAAPNETKLGSSEIVLEEGDDLLLVLEWLSGESLYNRLRREPLALADALDIVRRAAEGLSEAHRIGIVHRDIKPSNIWLVDGNPKSPKVLDFGISRRRDLDERLTRAGFLIGTPGYISPEQARGDPAIDARADVYSLGAVLFRILVGCAPHRGADEVAVIFKLLVEDAPRVRRIRPEIPEDVDDLVARMLARDPNARPQNTTELVRAIDGLTREVKRKARPNVISETERRVTSVVVIKLSPEDKASDEIASQIGAFGGEAQAFSADVVLASFKRDVAADLALRAVRCALALTVALPHSHFVVATGWAEPEMRTPATSTPSLPTSTDVMERAAELLDVPMRLSPIVIDEMTAGLVGDAFDVVMDLDHAFLKGERERSNDRPLAPAGSIYVGREPELAALRALADDTIDESHPRAALVLGPAGSGKSRFAQEIAGSLSRCTIWTASSDPMRAAQPLTMIASMFERVFELRLGEAPTQHRARIAERLARSVDAADVDRVSRSLGVLLGVPHEEAGEFSTSPTRLGDQMLSAFVDFVDAETRKNPLVIILDDLQWGDAVSVRYALSLMNALPDRAILILALGRPEADTMFPDFAEHEPLLVRLTKLSRRAAERMIRARLPDIADARIDAIVSRADGNPFCLEELVRAEARGARELPATVVAMAHARLEELPTKARRFLRAASIFGQSFWEGAMPALLGGEGERRRREGDSMSPYEAAVDVAGELARADVIALRPVSRFEGETELVFRQPLFREAAYAALTDEDRALGHRIAAAWLESHGEPQARVIAEHLDRGGAKENAVRAYARAAEQALESNDFAGTMECTSRSIACGASGALLGSLHLMRADAARWMSEHTTSAAEAERSLQYLVRGSPSWAMAVSFLASAASRLGNREQVRAASAMLISAFEEGARGPRVRAWLAAAGVALAVVGDRGEANRIRACLDIGDATSNEPFAMAYRERLIAYLALLDGELHEYLRRSEAVHRHFEDAEDIRSSLATGSPIGFAYLSLGCLDEASDVLRTVLARASRLDMKGLVTLAKHNLGMVLAWSGQIEEGKRVEQEAIAESVKQRDFRIEAGGRGYLARMHLMTGDLDAAEAEAERGLAIAPASLRKYLSAVRGQIHLTRGNALEALREVERLEPVSGAEEGDVLAALVRASALDKLGREDEARATLLETHEDLIARARRIPDPVIRSRFLTVVPEHKKLIDLASRISAAQ